MEKSIQHIFPQSIAQALCHTLLHSLWEGLFLALLTGLTIMLTRRATAALRYRLLVSALLLYTIAVVATFIVEFGNKTGGNSGLAAANTAIIPPFILTLIGWFNDLLKSAHEHAGMVSGAWLLIVGLQNIRLLFGIYTLERLKKYHVKPAVWLWQERTNRLCRELHINRAVMLIESAIAQVPVVIGYLKPVVLIPFGLVNSLEPAQVEAILLHELAHIARKDNLVNILQTILETLFFFNPAIWWLSSLIRTERENCCDDRVIAHTQNQISYMQALVHFEEYRLKRPRRAVALTGAPGSLLGRLERIVAGKNRSIGKLELIVLALILLFSTLFFAVSPRVQVRSLLKLPDTGLGSSSSQSMQAKKKAEAADRTRHKESSP